MREKRNTQQNRFEFQGHWLGREPGSDVWYAYRYEPAKRKVTRRSLHECDHERAKLALVQHALRASPPKKEAPESVSLGQVLLPYLDQTDKKPCGKGYRSAAKYIAEWWGAALVSELTQARQKDFIDWLGAKRFSPGYVKRIMGIISGALGYAVENDRLLSAPTVFTALGKIAERLDRPERMRGRRLTIAELAVFIDAIEAPHMLRYILLALNTLARPAAILELQRSQIGDDLIHLNPPGRRQNKKNRPTLPLTATLAAWLPAWEDERQFLVHFHGRKVDDPRVGIQNIAIRAELMTAADTGTPRSIHPYTFRRSMARILRGRGVSLEDLGAWMGHRVPGAATTKSFMPMPPPSTWRG